MENVVNMLEVVEENVNMMRSKDPYGYDSPPIVDEEPILVLKVPHFRELSHGPLVIKGPNSSHSSKPKQASSQNLNVVTQG